MTKSELRQNVINTGSHFFDCKTMKFFGDTMANYHITKNPVLIMRNGEYVSCWELRRVKPVKHGLSDSAYFDCKSFDRIHNVKY